MSELIIKDPDSSGFHEGLLSGAHFMYVCLQKPNKDQEGNQKYELKAVIDKATSKEFKKHFKQNKVYDIDTAEFKNVFKVDAPFPDQDEQYYVRFSMPATTEDGQPLEYGAFKRPKAYVPTGQVGVVEDITRTKLIGNGSTGDVSFYITEHKGKQFPKMRGILIDNLVEFAGRSGGGSPFGTVKGDDSPFGTTESATDADAEKESAPALIEENEKF